MAMARTTTFLRLETDESVLAIGAEENAAERALPE